MAVTLGFTNTRRTGLASSTACVLLHATLYDKISSFSYATKAGSIFSFFHVGETTARLALTLTTETLASAAVGALVLADDGTGNWRIANVLNDGTGALGPDGSTIAASARAATLITDNGQVPPLIGTVVTLTGTAADGSMWFVTTSGPRKVVVCGALTTVGALSSGTIAVVQTGNNWQIVQL